MLSRASNRFDDDEDAETDGEDFSLTGSGGSVEKESKFFTTTGNVLCFCVKTTSMTTKNTIKNLITDDNDQYQWFNHHVTVF